MTIITWIGSTCWTVYFGNMFYRWAVGKLASLQSRDDRDGRTLGDDSARLTRLEGRIDELVTALKTENSKLVTENVRLRLWLLQERADRIVEQKNAAGNPKLDAENDRTRINDLEGRMDRLNAELEASRTEKSKIETMTAKCLQSLMENIDLLYATITRDRVAKSEDNTIESFKRTPEKYARSKTQTTVASLTTTIDDYSSPDDVQTAEVATQPPTVRLAALPSPSSTLYASRNDREDTAFTPVTIAQVTSKNDVTGSNDSRYALRKVGHPKGVTPPARFPPVSWKTTSAAESLSLYDGEVSFSAVLHWLDANGLGTNDVWFALRRAGLIINLDECSPNWSDDPLPVLINMMGNIRKANDPFCLNLADDIGIVPPGRLSDAGYGFSRRVTMADTSMIEWDLSDFFSSDDVEIGLMRSLPPAADLREKASAGDRKDDCPSTRAEWRDDDEPKIDDYLRFLELAIWEERSFSEWFSSSSPDDVDDSEDSAVTPGVPSVDDDESGTDNDELYEFQGAGPDASFRECYSCFFADAEIDVANPEYSAVTRGGAFIDEMDLDEREIGEMHSRPSADSLEYTFPASGLTELEDDDEVDIGEDMWYILQ